MPALAAADNTPEPDDADLIAGTSALRAHVRVDEADWQALFPVAIADLVLTALTADIVLTPTAATCDIVFASDDTLADLNARFRNTAGPTNVLAFPAGMAGVDGEPHFLGGVGLAFGVMSQEAAARGIPLEHHATHLVLHGLLHLLGFDHEVETGRIAMEAVEVRILDGLGIADPYEGS